MNAQGNRLVSLDVLRGFDMFFVIGGSALMRKLCLACGLARDAPLTRQFEHVPWHGMVFEDTIFPLFLFIAGVTFPFSLARSRERGLSTGRILLKALWRGVALFLIGLLVQKLLMFDFAHLRLWSVLGRIGFAWMFAAFIFTLCRMRARIVWCVGLLVGYWLVLRFIPAPDFPGAELFSKEGCLACWIDRTFFAGHTLTKLYDPEGLAGLVPATATALLGMFTGAFVRSRGGALEAGGFKIRVLLAAAVALAALGFVWSPVFPLNKALWSSSFVLVAGGYSVAMFALFYWLVDIGRVWKHTLFFRVIGANAIVAYVARKMIGFDKTGQFFFGGVAALLPEAWSAVVLQLGFMFAYWLFLLFLYRKGVFLKI